MSDGEDVDAERSYRERERRSTETDTQQQVNFTIHADERRRKRQLSLSLFRRLLCVSRSAHACRASCVLSTRVSLAHPVADPIAHLINSFTESNGEEVKNVRKKVISDGRTGERKSRH